MRLEVNKLSKIGTASHIVICIVSNHVSTIRSILNWSMSWEFFLRGQYNSM